MWEIKFGNSGHLLQETWKPIDEVCRPKQEINSHNTRQNFALFLINCVFFHLLSQ